MSVLIQHQPMEAHTPRATFESMVGTRLLTGGQVSLELVNAIVSTIPNGTIQACSPTTCQIQTWNALSKDSEANHLLVQSATGSGKTIAFLVPILSAGKALLSQQQVRETSEQICSPFAVIIAPTRELCVQISTCAEAIVSQPGFSHDDSALRIACVIGGVGFNRQVSDLVNIGDGPLVIIATLGRLLSLCGIEKVKEKEEEVVQSDLKPFAMPWLINKTANASINDETQESETGTSLVRNESDVEPIVRVSLKRVDILVLDEADEMIRGGFGKDLECIGTLVPSTTTLLTFTATWNIENKSPIEILWPNQPKQRKVVVIRDESCGKARGGGITKIPPGVLQIVEVLSGSGKGAHRMHRMIAILQEVISRGENAMVFVMHKTETVQVARDFSRVFGDVCANLHGDMSSHARNEVLDAFRLGSIKILVCTDVAARGIDVAIGVNFVLNASLGISIDHYVHRCGRTGRPPLNQGIAHTLIVKGDEHLTPDLVAILSASQAKIPEELREMATRYKAHELKAERRKQSQLSSSSGKGAEDDDEQQVVLEQRIKNREKQKAILQQKQNKGRSQAKGKGQRRKKGH